MKRRLSLVIVLLLILPLAALGEPAPIAGGYAVVWQQDQAYLQMDDGTLSACDIPARSTWWWEIQEPRTGKILFCTRGQSFRFGLADAQGNVLRWLMAADEASGVLPYENRYALLSDARRVLLLDLDEVQQSTERASARYVRRGALWSCCDSSRYCQPFEPELALLQQGERLRCVTQAGRVGYEDARTGEIVIAVVYDEATPFEQGRAIVRQGRVYHQINAWGHIERTVTRPEGLSSAEAMERYFAAAASGDGLTAAMYACFGDVHWCDRRREVLLCYAPTDALGESTEDRIVYDVQLTSDDFETEPFHWFCAMHRVGGEWVVFEYNDYPGA